MEWNVPAEPAAALSDLAPTRRGALLEAFRRHAGLFAVLCMASITTYALLVIRDVTERQAELVKVVQTMQADANDIVLRELQNIEVSVGTGAAVQIGPTNKKAFVCEVPDSAAGCIRVGGSAVDSDDGIGYGPSANGCLGGSIIPYDVARAWAISTSGTVVLECAYSE